MKFVIYAAHLIFNKFLLGGDQLCQFGAIVHVSVTLSASIIRE
jgi:hypothetical protein